MSDVESTLKTAQYVETLKALLRARNVYLDNFSDIIGMNDKRDDEDAEILDILIADERQRNSAPNDICEENSIAASDEDTQYEYHLELRQKNTEISSITDTIYSVNSPRKRDRNRS